MMHLTRRSDTGQMLLATGVVLMMSLLSMAVFGVKMAGISMSHDTAGDDSIQASVEIAESLPLTDRIEGANMVQLRTFGN